MVCRYVLVGWVGTGSIGWYRVGRLVQEGRYVGTGIGGCVLFR